MQRVSTRREATWLLFGLLAACGERQAADGGRGSETSGSGESTSTDTDSTDEAENETETESEPDMLSGPCDPVVLTDPALDVELRDILELSVDDPISAEQAASVTHFSAFDRGVTSLAGLECLTNLSALYLMDNAIEDLSPIAQLEQLERLLLDDNLLTELPPLASIPNLRRLDLSGNALSDITVLADAAVLEQLEIGHTQIADLSPLTGLPALERLDITANPITTLDVIVTLPRLIELGMSSTGQADLSLLTGLPLENLRAADNGVVDVEPVTTLTPVEMNHVDLSGNLIEDLSPFETTSWMGGGCGVELLLEDNPVSSDPNFAQSWPYVCELGMFTIWDHDTDGYCGELPCP